jgi:hypothetical protein
MIQPIPKQKKQQQKQQQKKTKKKTRRQTTDRSISILRENQDNPQKKSI